ncbi:MAG: 6-phosphogluconolactonase [Deltaproteobacteria bacterium]|nr:6-phosphogluconolactonase [Deltaproteobacteria bacterium]
MASPVELVIGGRSARVFESSTVLSEAAARRIVDVARACVSARGRFWWALAGGTTPRAVYERLAQPPFVSDMPWAGTFVFFGDERAVPLDHPDSNFRMAREAMLSHVPIPAENVFSVVNPHFDADRAAADYEARIRAAWGDRDVPVFDLVLLGIGEDGHTASLFPETEALLETQRLVIQGRKGNSPRVTFTFPLINQAARVWFFVTGESKAPVITRIFAEEPPELPAARVRPTSGECLWWLDHAAASTIK